MSNFQKTNMNTNKMSYMPSKVTDVMVPTTNRHSASNRYLSKT